jgi:CheY-specific phosphatase CheX
MPGPNHTSPNWKDQFRLPGAAKLTPAPVPAQDLREKFQLAPQPVGVQKIASLVKGRESASMDEISNIISSDSGVTQRLINIAYPRQTARIGATVQMATSRLGVNRVIVVMVGDLLTKAVTETFETMVSMPLEVADPSSIPPTDHGYLTGSVKFSGESNGQVTLAFSPHLTLVLTARLMGGELGGDEHTPEVINDAIGELVNIVTGNLQSKLCDAGLSSEVGLPEVSYQPCLPKAPANGGSNDHFFFRFGSHTLVVILNIDPSAQKISAVKAPMTKGTSWRANGV